ncbi:MAG: orotate phosphoribosyltransferase [Bacteroidetes bacterium]|nr:orotate phosphoribosyltransferase [Rhodothermia bacterium]MCS7156052.1 orotate phosphoribosyltransferase [Bacteroidota bacterium]MCX7907740.1 orotate phosphoribosyltransferase [Bacteroidota bacterium]MDW8137869.1 orotate phosphoribosyltransferase [Bacteroidota bacterium]MDW8286280.1 orotate phosphoribosyltransferase [Bacteroidota bacterium]
MFLLRQETAAQVAEGLLRLGAVTLRPEAPFRWTSGLWAPIYCDNRLLMADPPLRAFVADALAEAIRTRYPEATLVAGTATAAVPHAAWVAERLQLPMVYVRTEPKGHGQGKQVEGLLPAGARTVLIEDLLSTGRSSLRAIEALRREGAHPVAVAAIFAYGLPGTEERFRQADLPVLVLCTLRELVEVALREGELSSEQAALIWSWHQDPEAWSRRYAEGRSA